MDQGFSMFGPSPILWLNDGVRLFMITSIPLLFVSKFWVFWNYCTSSFMVMAIVFLAKNKIAMFMFLGGSKFFALASLVVLCSFRYVQINYSFNENMYKLKKC